MDRFDLHAVQDELLATPTDLIERLVGPSCIDREYAAREVAFRLASRIDPAQVADRNQFPLPL